jgi:hypothetical protein
MMLSVWDRFVIRVRIAVGERISNCDKDYHFKFVKCNDSVAEGHFHLFDGIDAISRERIDAEEM